MATVVVADVATGVAATVAGALGLGVATAAAVELDEVVEDVEVVSDEPHATITSVTAAPANSVGLFSDMFILRT